MIQIFNTLSGKKELFTPLHDTKARLYVCGITPYDYAHVGHGRVYVTFDAFYRLLQHAGYNVNYCRNFTDIDDKLLCRAQERYQDSSRYQEIAAYYIAAYHADMRLLNCRTPTYEPRVTDNIKEIIEFIQGLINTKRAYQTGNDVYFSIKNFENYGKLSKRDLNDLQAGARVAIRENKKSPLDFALWKAADAHEVGWQSPWGYGRPGWHIECSALAYKYLGKQIDIHAGGMDLIFPHHENEIAQSEGLFNVPFARYWMHNAFVEINKEKMSKSLKNFFTLRDVFAHYDPQVIRYYILMHHYRVPMDFSFDDIAAAQKSYARLITLFEQERLPGNQIDFKYQPIAHRMLEFLYDDLNTPGMFGVLFENFKQLQENTDERTDAYYILTNILGLTLQPLPEKKVTITPEIQALLDARKKAREEKNWQKADELREQLIALGIDVHDKKLN